MAASSSSKHTAIRLVLILSAALVLFALVTYFYKKGGSERFSASSSSSSAPKATMPFPPPSPPPKAAMMGPEPYSNGDDEPQEELFPSSSRKQQRGEVEHFLKDSIRPDELLPKNAANSQWAMANPAGQGDLKDQNFLTAGYHLGFDTQGNSLKNASHDIRSSPPNPRYRVSIWQQSSIEPDLNRRPLE